MTTCLTGRTASSEIMCLIGSSFVLLAGFQWPHHTLVPFPHLKVNTSHLPTIRQMANCPIFQLTIISLKRPFHCHDSWPPTIVSTNWLHSGCPKHKFTYISLILIRMLSIAYSSQKFSYNSCHLFEENYIKIIIKK